MTLSRAIAFAVVWLLLSFPGMASNTESKTAQLEIEFRLVEMRDNYDSNPKPVGGVHVRLALNSGSSGTLPPAEMVLITDADGRSTFSTLVSLGSRRRARNIGFTPFSKSESAEYLDISFELDHLVELSQQEKPQLIPLRISMDLFCFKDGSCSSDGFTRLHAKDQLGVFSVPLRRLGGKDMWALPDRETPVLRGMQYRIGDFLLQPLSEVDSRRRLKLLLIKLPQR